MPQGCDINALHTGHSDQIASVTGSCREKSWSCLGSQTILDTRFHFCVILSLKFLSEGFREKVRNGIPDWMTEGTGDTNCRQAPFYFHLYWVAPVGHTLLEATAASPAHVFGASAWCQFSFCRPLRWSCLLHRRGGFGLCCLSKCLVWVVRLKQWLLFIAIFPRLAC